MGREFPVDRRPRPKARPGGSSIDAALLAVMLLVALGSGSLALLGETIRSALAMTTAVWAFVVLTRAARDAGRRYQFGAGKLEQTGTMIVALIQTVAGLWLVGRALGPIMVGASGPAPLGLALAATASAAHAMRAGFNAVRARSAVEAEAERTPRAASSAGISGWVSLVVVQATLTVAALARDSAVALAADCLGAIVVGLLMTAAGVRMLREATLDLIDHPLRGGGEEAIARLLLEQGVHAQELVGMRSRRSGRDVFVELTLDPVDGRSLAETHRRLARARRVLADRLGGADVSIRLRTPED